MWLFMYASVFVDAPMTVHFFAFPAYRLCHPQKISQQASAPTLNPILFPTRTRSRTKHRHSRYQRVLLLSLIHSWENITMIEPSEAVMNESVLGLIIVNLCLFDILYNIYIMIMILNYLCDLIYDSLFLIDCSSWLHGWKLIRNPWSQ